MNEQPQLPSDILLYIASLAHLAYVRAIWRPTRHGEHCCGGMVMWLPQSQIIFLKCGCFFPKRPAAWGAEDSPVWKPKIIVRET